MPVMVPNRGTGGRAAQWAVARFPEGRGRVGLRMGLVLHGVKSVLQFATVCAPLGTGPAGPRRPRPASHFPGRAVLGCGVCRRAFLDVIGTLPTAREVRAFLDVPAPDKRARLVEHLLAHSEFADYRAVKWSDLLRVKAEFPVNLWPNAAQAYHCWILARSARLPATRPLHLRSARGRAGIAAARAAPAPLERDPRANSAGWHRRGDPARTLPPQGRPDPARHRGRP